MAVVIEDLTELKLARAALQRQAEFRAFLVSVAMPLIGARPDQLDEAMRNALAELCRFCGFLRVAILRLSSGVPTELYHQSAGLGQRGLARVREKEIRALSARHAQLIRDRHLVVEPERTNDARRGSAGLLALATEGPAPDAITCYPAPGTSALSDDTVKQLRDFSKLLTAALASAAGEHKQHPVEKRNTAGAVIDRIRFSSCQIIGASEKLREFLEAVEVVAATPTTVLIQGESGVGKELAARAIQELSDRAALPFVIVNCASIPRELFESEFFGHVRGAFTGAHRDRIGRFERANGGTIFLDEVAEIPLELQPKLLRVLQEGEFEPLGDHRTRRVDVRVIAATNRDLQAEVHAGQFRQDLYYRLSVFPLHVPPLRERPEDIVQLARHFLSARSAALGRKGLVLTEEHERALLAYDWPGNVRELQNVLERAVICSVRPPLRIQVPQRTDNRGLTRNSSERPFMTASELREKERRSLLAALAKCGWRVSGQGGAAELLGMRPSTLRDRLHALGIRRP